MNRICNIRFLKLQVSALLAVCLVITTIIIAPVNAYAAGTSQNPVVINLLTVSEDGSGYIWDDVLDVLVITESGYYKVTGGNATPTERKIVVDAGGAVNLTADRLNIKTDVNFNIGIFSLAMQNYSNAALSLGSETSLTLTLSGVNKLGGAQGIYVPYDASIIITGSGSLIATAEGKDEGQEGAAIGSTENSTSGRIEILDTTVTASTIGLYGSYGSAAIGGGRFGSNGPIYITGSNVVANGGNDAAGIGPGYRNSPGGEVVITDSDVTATSGNDDYSGTGIEGTSIEITNSTVFASGRDGGAAINSSTTTDIINSRIATDLSHNGTGIQGGGNISGNSVLYGPTDNWTGSIDDSIVIDDTFGAVYGSFVIDGNFEIPAGAFIDIEPGASLIVNSGSKLTNNGTIVLSGGSLVNNGTIENYGTLPAGITGDPGAGGVTTTAKVHSITVSGSPFLHLGDSQSYTADVIAGGGAGNQCTWSISGAKGSTAIDQTGQLTIGADETSSKITVIATSVFNPSVSGKFEVKIVIPITSVAINKQTLTLGIGNKETLFPIVMPSEASIHDMNFSTEDDRVVTVDQKTGVITAKNKGTATISVEVYDGDSWFDCNSYSLECAVTVVSPVSINPAPITIANIPNQTYNGLAKTPALTVKYGGTLLIKDQDYSVAYSNNVKQGIAKATITGKGIYNGTVSVNFVIQDTIAKATVAAVKDQTWTGKAITPAVTIKHGALTLVNNTHHTLAYSSNKEIGKATVKVSGKGIYNGAKTVTFNILPKPITVGKVTPGKKNLKVTWAKASAAQKITGYQVRYRVSGTSKWTTKTVAAKKSSLTIKNLKKNKKYQVEVRVYKTVNKVNYCSAWSKTKTSGKVK